jgi:hypothetical protein
VGYDAAIASFLLVSWSLWLPNFYFQIYAFMNSRLKDRVSCAGYYDYLDAILKTTNSGRSVRLFVDLDFRTQFEIARPTREYRALLELLQGTQHSRCSLLVLAITPVHPRELVYLKIE